MCRNFIEPSSSAACSVLHARYPVQGVGTALPFSHPCVPWFSSQPPGFPSPSGCGCRDRGDRNTKPDPFDRPALSRAARNSLPTVVRCPAAKRFDGNTQRSHLPWHRAPSRDKTLSLIGTLRLPLGVLLSDAKMNLLIQSMFSIRIRRFETVRSPSSAERFKAASWLSASHPGCSRIAFCQPRNSRGAVQGS